jgi:adenine/guanine phosphoribosyltransferase-like PRPP-binding protein
MLPDKEPIHVSAERFVELLEELRAAALQLNPRPDAVVGIKRSGLFPAVYLSQQLKLPMFTDYEAQQFPYPRLALPLVVDTVAWSGGSLRHTLRQLQQAGVQQAQVLVMFVRAEPAPTLEAYAPMVGQLRYLYQASAIPRFWYTA